VTYTAKFLSDAAREDAAEFNYLLDIVPSEPQQALEFYFNSLEFPNYIIMEGKLIVKSPAKNNTGTFQIFGDDGPLYIQVNGEPIFKRKFKIPILKMDKANQDCDALMEAIKGL
jgi:hypothetical protein